MEYKRLTKYSKENQDYITPYCDTANCNGVCVDCDYEQVIINRLAEFEDDLESGKLVRLPCKVGDKVYRICGTPKRRFIKEKTCQGICFNNFGIEIHTDGAVDVLTKENKNIFLTKAEAEQKLKELKEEV